MASDWGLSWRYDGWSIVGDLVEYVVVRLVAWLLSKVLPAEGAENAESPFSGSRVLPTALLTHSG